MALTGIWLYNGDSIIPEFMKIRAKLSLTFILLLIFGVTAVSSYSILYIRAYLLEDEVRQMKEDGKWMVYTVQFIPEGPEFWQRLDQIRQVVRYQLALYDESGRVLAVTGQNTGEEDVSAGNNRLLSGAGETLADSLMRQVQSHQDYVLVINERSAESVLVYGWLPQSINQARYLRISLSKDEIFEPIATIRWIIYTGMFISIGLILIVSSLFSRYLSRPIIALNQAARKIAGGDVNHKIHLKRRDEFGNLSESLNQMATRLREDNEQLQRVNEKQLQFFADIAHEVRNPLHTIMGSLEMLEMNRLDDEKRKKYIKNASGQTERLSRLFSDLMTLQRYDSDENFIQKKNFDLGEITRKIDEWYREKAEEKAIRLEIDTHRAGVHADPGKIEQVLDNLISNALKFTSRGEVSLKYETEGDLVHIRITDTGPGIPEEHIPKLFDRFYRTDKARSREQGGTGLGLAIVHSILEAHGCRISVDSRPGKGSRFMFSLPKI